MKLEEYTQAQHQLTTLAAFALQLPADEMLRQIEHSNTVAPFLDPTLWMRGHRRLEAIAELARAAAAFKRVAEKFRDEFLQIEIDERMVRDAFAVAEDRP